MSEHPGARPQPDRQLRGRIERTLAGALRLIDWRSHLERAAEAEAARKKEGGFLGIGGKQISEGEQELSEEIAKALGTTSQLG